MEKLTIKIKKLSPDAKIPTKGSKNAAAIDFYSDERVYIKNGEFKLVSSGIALSIPHGYFMYLRPRSGKATKEGLELRSSNIIDSDYRGEVKFGCFALGVDSLTINKGEKIIQGLILPVYNVDLIEVGELDQTERDINGFGSTGKF